VKFTLDSEDQNSSRPINEHPPLKYNAEEIIKVLLLAEDNKICRVKPSAVTQSATYVIDTRSLQNPEDIKKDEFGIWRYSGSHPKRFKVYTEDDGHMTVEKCCDGTFGNNVLMDVTETRFTILDHAGKYTQNTHLGIRSSYQTGYLFNPLVKANFPQCGKLELQDNP
jgi:hypothetical protein